MSGSIKNISSKSNDKKAAKYPEWVEGLFKELTPVLRDRIVKCTLYALVTPSGDDFKIDEILQGMSNRVELLPSYEVVSALAIAEVFTMHHSAQIKDEKLNFK